MRYKLRIVSVHTGQGGGFKEQEKRRGEREGEKMRPITMAIFVILFLQNGTNLMTMMLMMWMKMICC